jgi:hypothetical protein
MQIRARLMTALQMFDIKKKARGKKQQARAKRSRLGSLNVATALAQL